MRILIIILCFFLPALASAQTETITLKTTRILDGKGKIIENQNILIKDGKILEIGKKVVGKVYDLSGLTLMPGGIDTHNHLDWHFDADGKFHDATPEQESDVQRALYAAENAYLTLQAGITTSQSLGGAIDGDVRDAINRNVLPGPHVLTSLGAITARTGDPDSMRAAVNRFADEGANVIKVFASASIRDGGAPTLSQEQLNAICSEAKKRGLRIVVHAHGSESARRAILAGCTTIEHGVLFDKEILELMAKNGTYFDPHIWAVFNNYFEHRDEYVGISGYSEEGFKQMEQAVPKAIAMFKEALNTKGLKIVYGTDAVAGAHGHNFEELIARVEKGGQSPMDAIVSAGSMAAQSLNLADQIGTLAPGMHADIIALEGDPLKDIKLFRNVKFVMKEGVIYKNWK